MKVEAIAEAIIFLCVDTNTFMLKNCCYYELSLMLDHYIIQIMCITVLFDQSCVGSMSLQKLSVFIVYLLEDKQEIGRASCRERVYVLV